MLKAKGEKLSIYQDFVHGQSHISRPNVFVTAHRLGKILTAESWNFTNCAEWSQFAVDDFWQYDLRLNMIAFQFVREYTDVRGITVHPDTRFEAIGRPAGELGQGVTLKHSDKAVCMLLLHVLKLSLLQLTLRQCRLFNGVCALGFLWWRLLPPANAAVVIVSVYP